MEDAVSSSLLEMLHRGVYGLSGGGEGAGGQSFDLLCVSNFGACFNYLLACFLEFVGEVSEL